MPRVSVDQCFLGRDESEESAHASSFLVIFDNASEALQAVAVSDKMAQFWVVEYVARVVEELGYLL